jgi:hypothetical protein
MSVGQMSVGQIVFSQKTGNNAKKLFNLFFKSQNCKHVIKLYFFVIYVLAFTKSLQTVYNNGTAHFFFIFIDYRGHHRKGAAIYNAT